MRNSLPSTNHSHMTSNTNFNNNNNKDYESSVGFKSTMNDNEGNSMMKMTHSYDNLKVVIRVRPALPREMEQDLPFRSIVE